MRTKIWILSIFTASNILGQSVIENITTHNHAILGLQTNSLATYAGIDYGLEGIEILPSFQIIRQNGLFFSLQPSFYTDSKITKKTFMPEITLGIGYGFEIGKYEGSFGISHTQIFYGNSTFRGFLNNDITLENKINISDYFEFNLNPTYIFSTKSKNQNAFLLEVDAQLHLFIEHFLGSDQLVISPTLSYYYGNDIFVQNFSKRDIIDNTALKNNIIYSTLSVVPSIKFQIQTNRSEWTTSISYPYIRNSNPTTNQNLSPQSQILSLGYNFYIGKK